MFQIIEKKDSTATLSKGIILYLKKRNKSGQVDFQKWTNLFGFRKWSTDYPKQDIKFKFGNKTVFAQFQENPNCKNNGFEGRTCIVLIIKD